MLQYERGIAFFGANLQIALCVQINLKPNVEISADCTRVCQPPTLAHLDNTIFNESNICGGAAHIHNHDIFFSGQKGASYDTGGSTGKYCLGFSAAISSVIGVWLPFVIIMGVQIFFWRSTFLVAEINSIIMGISQIWNMAVTFCKEGPKR